MTFEGAAAGPGIVATVPLKPAPFQLRFPKRGDEPSLRICAWTDDSVFTDRGGQAVESDGCFGLGWGIADFEFGSGTLYLNDEGFNYLIGDRFQSLSDDTGAVDSDPGS